VLVLLGEAPQRCCTDHQPWSRNASAARKTEVTTGLRAQGLPGWSTPSAGFASDGIGTGFDASAKYVYHKYFVVQAGVGHFFPGQIMTHSGHGAPLTISWLQLTYRFKTN